ncbi:MAG: transcriptional regulator of arginine metabolism [Acidobacteriota bacterium]|jgi:transcriptional regulator of arginine metabolism|nr:transcriptional regulator of arginine metabolism [Acidobacteriota bacterium]
MPSDREVQDKRRLAILKILKGEEKIAQQKEIVQKLQEMGIPATQSSVSRDLSEIGAVRIRGQWMLIGIHDVGVFERVANLVTEIRFAGPNIIIVKTQPGAGALVSQALDESQWDEVEGTVAGLSSVLILTHDAFFQKIVNTRLQGYLRDGDAGQLPVLPWRVTRKFT